MENTPRTYNIKDIETLFGIDRRALDKRIKAAGLTSKETFSEEEFYWINRANEIRGLSSNKSWDSIKEEIQTEKYSHLHLSGEASSNTTSSQDSTTDDFMGEVVEEILQEQITANFMRLIPHIPAMINKSIRENSSEIKALTNSVLRQNKERLSPMRNMKQIFEIDSQPPEEEEELDISEEDEDLY